MSLNFAMFREAFERGESLGAGPIARTWRRVLMMGNSNWQLESLYRSNAKYSPDWQPRYICFEYSSDLPRVGIAAGNAEGFLTRPSLALALRRGKEEGARAHWIAPARSTPPRWPRSSPPRRTRSRRRCRWMGCPSRCGSGARSSSGSGRWASTPTR